MDNAWPLWALPFWTMGVPLIWAFVEKYRSSRYGGETTNFGVRPLGQTMVRQEALIAAGE